jgi:hypothetical protein
MKKIAKLSPSRRARIARRAEELVVSQYLLEALHEQVATLRELIEHTLVDTTIRDLCLRDVLERGEQAIAQAEGVDHA